MTIDAHHHVWDLARRDQPWIDPATMSAIHRDFDIDELGAAAMPVGVRATVVVQTIADPEETPELLALAKQASLVAGVVGWADLTDPGLTEVLRALRERPGGDRLVGIRHPVQGEADPRWLCRPDVRRGLAAVGEAGLCYDLLTTVDQLDAAVETVRALPQVRFVLDHLSKPLIRRGQLLPWRDQIKELAGAPNVAAKLSGLVTEADWSQWTVDDLRPYVDIAVEAFGPGRVMFGSDWPVCLLAARSYGTVLDTAERLTAALSDGERALVFAGTAERWYGLRLDD